MTTIATILGISLLIVLHELGHFLLARAFGMHVVRFSVGFGPALWRYQANEDATLWQIAAIPLGGYVQIHGMGAAPDDAQDAHTRGIDARSFRERPLWQRMLVIAAGPAANWLLAAAFIALLAMTVGFERTDPQSTLIGEVTAGSPAAAAGIQAGDRVVSVDGATVESWSTLHKAVIANANAILRFEVERGQQRLLLDVVPALGPAGEGASIGVRAHVEVIRLGPLDGCWAGVAGAWRFTRTQTRLLWGLATGSGKGRLSGLPSIIKMAAAQAEHGLRYLLQFLAWLSIGLCLLNLLPVPGLDGARLVFLFLEAVRRRPVDHRIEGVVHGIGFLLLLAAMIFVSVRDLL